MGTKLTGFREILTGGEPYRELGEGKKGEEGDSGGTFCRPWSLQDLQAYPWVGIGSGTATCELYRAFFFRRNVDIGLDTEVATSDLLIPLIRAGMGIGFVPEEMAQPWLDAGQLVRIPLDCEPPKREIRLVYDSGRGRSAAAEGLRNYLQKYLREQAG